MLGKYICFPSPNWSSYNLIGFRFRSLSQMNTCVMIQSIATRTHTPGLSIDHKEKAIQKLFFCPPLSLPGYVDGNWQGRRVWMLISMGRWNLQREAMARDKRKWLWGLNSHPSLSFVGWSWGWDWYCTLKISQTFAQWLGKNSGQMIRKFI